MKVDTFEVSNNSPFFLIAGNCVVESMESAIETAGRLKEITKELGIPFVYKSSFDKANRSSIDGFRGPGLEEGLKILSEVKSQLGVPLITDVHDDSPLDEVADVVDILQTPSFLCRQTNFILNVARQGKTVNIKKGQWVGPDNLVLSVDKVRAANSNCEAWICDRGSNLGYDHLVTDFTIIDELKEQINDELERTFNQ